MILTDIQKRVLGEIKTGAKSPKGYPRTYEGGPEYDAAMSLKELGLVAHTTDKPEEWIGGQFRAEHPAGWYLTAAGFKFLEAKQPVVVLLEDQGEIVDVVGPFDTPEKATTWAAYQQAHIAPVGMEFLIRNVSEPGPGNSEEEVRQQGLEADLAERDRQEDQPPFGGNDHDDNR